MTERLYDTPDEAHLRKRAEKAERHLRDLLAIIHRDDGTHTEKVGLEQSVEDAHVEWGRTMTALETMREVLVAADHAIKFSNHIGTKRWSCSTVPCPTCVAKAKTAITAALALVAPKEDQR